MSAGPVEHWLLPVVFVAIGIACLFVDNTSGRGSVWEGTVIASLYPRMTLHRHPLFRYAMAAILFVLAIVAFVVSS